MDHGLEKNQQPKRGKTSLAFFFFFFSSEAHVGLYLRWKSLGWSPGWAGNCCPLSSAVAVDFGSGAGERKWGSRCVCGWWGWWGPHSIGDPGDLHWGGRTCWVHPE